MSDLISRQAAIDALENKLLSNPYYDPGEPINGLGLYDIRTVMNDVPHVQPKPGNKRYDFKTKSAALYGKSVKE